MNNLAFYQSISQVFRVQKRPNPLPYPTGGKKSLTVSLEVVKVFTFYFFALTLLPGLALHYNKYFFLHVRMLITKCG